MRQRVRRADDEGQLAILIIGYTVIAALLVTVVVDLSHAFLYRRALAAAADGAAVAAASSPDLDALYRHGAGNGLPLDQSAARRAVEQYVADAGLAGRFRGLEIASVDVRADAVAVTFVARLRLPVLNSVVNASEGRPVVATATAVVPLG
jgi:uncharacterized membrane protein